MRATQDRPVAQGVEGDSIRSLSWNSSSPFGLTGGKAQVGQSDDGFESSTAISGTLEDWPLWIDTGLLHRLFYGAAVREIAPVSG